MTVTIANVWSMSTELTCIYNQQGGTAKWPSLVCVTALIARTRAGYFLISEGLKAQFRQAQVQTCLECQWENQERANFT